MRRFADVMVSAVVLVMACGGGSSTPVTSPNTPGTPGTPGTPTCTGTGGAVSVVNNAFEPSCMKVTPGSSVTWTFNGTGHNVTFGGSLGGSGPQSPGATYTKNFPTAGTFDYSCTNHAGMTGSVVVQ